VAINDVAYCHLRAPDAVPNGRRSIKSRRTSPLPPLPTSPFLPLEVDP